MTESYSDRLGRLLESSEVTQVANKQKTEMPTYGMTREEDSVSGRIVGNSKVY